MSTNEQTSVVAINAQPVAIQNYKVRPFIPQSYEDAFKLATIVFESGMAPKALKSPAQVFVVQQKGASVGLDPMQSLDVISCIHGKAGLYADGPLALVRQSGKLKYIEEWIEGTGDSMIAYCKAQRIGEDKAVTGVFSMAQAGKAQLTSKVGPWNTYTDVMLGRKARKRVLDFLFPEVLLGLKTLDEVEEVHAAEMQNITPNNVPSEFYKGSILVDDYIPEYKSSVSSKGPELNNKFVSLHGVEPIENITLLKEELFGYLKDKLEAIETAEEFEAHTAWSRSNYAATKSVIDKDSAEGKALGDLFFAKKRRFEKTNYTENSNLDL